MLPFDESGPSEPLVVTVGEFTTRLTQIFRRIKSFDRLGVSGEISNWRPGPSGINFRLSEGGAVLDCFAYQSASRNFPPIENGMAVIAYGSVSVWGPKSAYQLLVESVLPAGAGALHLRQRELKERFAREGLFDPARKRAVPRFVRSVALVSAHRQGAEDFLKVVRVRAPQVRVVLVETPVQGQGAEVHIADALDRASRQNVDAIALVRGGGSYEDLFPFNLEPVVRAIVRSGIPVITGIGHSGDRHLADDVSDLSFDTPSLAAEFIVKRWETGELELNAAAKKLGREVRISVARAEQRFGDTSTAFFKAVGKSLSRYATRLSGLERRIDARSPQRRLHDWQMQLQSATQRLNQWPVRFLIPSSERISREHDRLANALQRGSLAREGRLERGVIRLNFLDPFQPLERGYTVILKNDRVVRDATQLRAGDGIVAQMHRGTVAARVESVDLHE